MRALVAILSMIALAGSASACINDRELESHEREFRSSYQDAGFEQSAEEADNTTEQYVVGGLGATGILLSIAGGVMVLRMRA